MIKFVHLCIAIIVVTIVSAVLEILFTDIFFISTTIGFLGIIIFYALYIKNRKLNLASSDNAHF